MSVKASHSRIFQSMVGLAALVSIGRASAETHSYQETCREVTTSYSSSGRIIRAICRMKGDNALAERFTQLNLAPGMTCGDISNYDGILHCNGIRRATGSKLPPGSRPY
jgi:hypothetical protein